MVEKEVIRGLHYMVEIRIFFVKTKDGICINGQLQIQGNNKQWIIPIFSPIWILGSWNSKQATRVMLSQNTRSSYMVVKGFSDTQNSPTLKEQENKKY